MTEALIGTCILAITTVIFVWVCSEYQIYNNEHSAEEKLNTPRLSSWFAAQRMRFWFAVDDAREYPQEVLKSENKTLLQNGLESIMKNTRFEAGSAENIIRYRVKEPIVCGETYKREIVLSQRRGDVKCISFI